MIISGVIKNMTNEDNILIQKFVDRYLDLVLDIGEVKKIDQEKVTSLEYSFRDMKLLALKNQSVPLDVAGIFIDLYSAIESQSSRYQNQQEILELADYLAVLARDVCDVVSD